MSDLRNVLLLAIISFYSSAIFARWDLLPGISSEFDTINIFDCPRVLDVAVGLRAQGIEVFFEAVITATVIINLPTRNHFKIIERLFF